MSLQCQTSFSNTFCYKDPIVKDLISGAVYKFGCGLYNELYYRKSVRHLDIKPGEHIGFSLTRKKRKPSNNSAFCDHFLHCSYLPSFSNVST